MKTDDPDLVQAFLKKWWVESDFKAPNLSLSLRLKVIDNRLMSTQISRNRQSNKLRLGNQEIYNRINDDPDIKK